MSPEKAHTTLEMDDNVIYLNFEYVNLVSSCLFASQTWSTKVRKVDFTALNRLARLQGRTTDSIDQFDFRQLFRLDSTPTSNDRLDRFWGLATILAHLALALGPLRRQQVFFALIDMPIFSNSHGQISNAF